MKTSPAFKGLLMAGAAALLLANPASAQKSNDTLRMASNDPYAILSPYDLPLDEASLVYNQVYSPFLSYDEYNGKFVPELLKSWKHISPTILEFELREDITLHTGKNMTADDAVASIEYPINPKTKIRGKGRYKWVQRVEKLGTYKFRIHLGKPYALDLFSLAYRFFIHDSDVYKSLENQADYGRVSMASAGPYKVISNDRNTGYVLKRFDKFNGKKSIRRAPIGTIKIIPIGDTQTQVAQLMTGGIDVVRNVPRDIAKNLAADPRFEISNTLSKQYTYLTMDKVGRSKFKMFMNKKVRMAAVMGIDRAAIAREIVPGGSSVKIMQAMCFKQGTSGCDYDVEPYKYDPAQAKRLLAEAGYPDGFDLTMYVHTPSKDIAVAIAGQWRRIGIRASITPLPIGAYVKKRGKGELTAFVGARPTASFPEATNILGGFFSGGRDYWKEPSIISAMKIAFNTADPTERAKILKPVHNMVNQEAFILPIATSPWVYAHTKDVKIGKHQFQVNRVTISDLFWK
ncbi:MAG: hypothetical protein HQ503_04625 [Rhodospirillales bacterium]|nr:hypothetical protein [Rhodospirillales bacterium]